MVYYFFLNKLKQGFFEREKTLHAKDILITKFKKFSKKNLLTQATSERENLSTTKFSKIKINLKEVNNLKQNFKEILTDNSLLTKKENLLKSKQKLLKENFLLKIAKENSTQGLTQPLNLSLKDLSRPKSNSGVSLKEFVSTDLTPNLQKEDLQKKSIKKTKKKILTEYNLETFHRSNQDTSLFHKPLVSEGDWVQAGEILTDCSASVGGELSLGQNLLIAYMPWEGYNYEDAILISQRLVSDDLYTSVHIERYDIQIKETKLGVEEITRSIPDVHSHELDHLDSNGIAKIGSWIQEGDILVGKITPINKKSQSPYQKLLYTILEKQFIPIRDSSLRAPKGIKAKVIDIKVFYSEKRSKISKKLTKKESLAKEKMSVNNKNLLTNNLSLQNQSLEQNLDLRSKSNQTNKVKVKTSLLGCKFSCKSFFSKKRFTKLNFLSSEKKENLKRKFTLVNLLRRNKNKQINFYKKLYNKFVLLKFNKSSGSCPRQFYGQLFYSLVNNYLASKNKKISSNNKAKNIPAFLLEKKENSLIKNSLLNYFTLLKNQNYLKKNLSFNKFIQKILNSINIRCRTSWGGTKTEKLKNVLGPVLGTLGKKKKVRKIRSLIFRLKNNLVKISNKNLLKKKVSKASILNKPIIRISNTSPRKINLLKLKRTNYLNAKLYTKFKETFKILIQKNLKDLKLNSAKLVKKDKVGDNKKCLSIFKSLVRISQKNKTYKKRINFRKSMANQLITKYSFKKILKRKQTNKILLSNLVPNNLNISSSKNFTNKKVKFNCSAANISSIAIYLAEKRKVQVGDKMAGRHGNKGIISQILPREDMPYLPNGTPIDMVLNPLGVPSRMNVGQIYECLLGLAGKFLGENYKIFPFDEIYGAEASRSFVFNRLNMARNRTGFQWLFNPNTPGKMRIYDGRTGDTYDQPVTVGIAYMLRLVHMVDDKIHMRSTGPYSLVTQQPLRGRSKQGGQRLGEMEVWALEGYGAAFTLLEMLTIKSDDMTGRMTLWSNLILNNPISIGTPESFKVLVCELQALCLDVGIFRYNPSKLAASNSNQQNVEIYKSDLVEITNLINLP